MALTVTLFADDLLSKWGFSDGDLMNGDHDILIESVRRYLLPLLDPRIEVDEFVTAHNPIRATEDTRQFVDPNVSVVVPYSVED